MHTRARTHAHTHTHTRIHTRTHGILTGGVEDEGCGKRAAQQCGIDWVLKVVEGPIRAERLHLIASWHRCAHLQLQIQE